MTTHPLAPALPILQRLESAHYQAYAVGGCVRDILRQVPPHDFDLTTNALPEEILSLFSDCVTIPTGLAHGTITVLWEQKPIEITTYRTDGCYTDARHPDHVTFTASLFEDLARRDFTVNAMAMNAKAELIDPFHGLQDLQKGILRAVGDPQKRFSEDALRILRLWRFACTLGFTMEEKTQNAALARISTLEKIATERIFSEFSKGICAPHFSTLLFHPLTQALFAQIAPEYLPLWEQERTPYALSALKNAPFALLWSALSSLANLTAQDADRRLAQLRCDNHTRQHVLQLLSALHTPLPDHRIACKRLLALRGEALFLDDLRLRHALFAEATDVVLHQAKSLIAENACLSLSALSVKGEDLLALGYQGKEVGDTLRRLLEAVIEERLPNEKEPLLRALQEKEL